jgi:RNA polymerase sigma factor (sigma-70 family)
MLAFARRYLVHRPQHSMEAEDLVQEATLRLLRTSDAAPEQPGLRPFLAYLQRTIFHCAVSAERQLLGRMRCGNCKHYGLFSRQCLASQHSWTAKGLAADQDPRQLDPPCDRFITARSPREIESAPEPKQPEPRENPAAEQLYRALVELAAVQPRAALVLRARLLDGRPYADLEELGASTRTLKRDYRTGLEFLRRRLATD